VPRSSRLGSWSLVDEEDDDGDAATTFPCFGLLRFVYAQSYETEALGGSGGRRTFGATSSKMFFVPTAVGGVINSELVDELEEEPESLRGRAVVMR
jgi:hypothetical protein